MDERVKIIADKYGKQNQLHQLMEECCELAIEANHSARKQDMTINLINEIADVEIMVEQIKYLFNISEKDIEEEKDYKLNRQLERIKYD